jgi:ubiquinone/menaquinone biosynthesis C-methylase UbiE
MRKFQDLYASLAQMVRQYISKSHACIVDLGSGSGLLSVEILKQIPDAVVIGIDPLTKMLVLAKENIRDVSSGRFEAVQGVSENIPLKNNSVDVIVSRFSLPYWKHPAQSFLEMNRILQPHGKVVFEGLNRDFPFWKLFVIKIHMLVNKAGKNVARYHIDAYKDAHTIQQVEQLFSNAGFRIVEKEGKKKEWRFIVIAEKQ